jgi:hypothetical protein
LEIPQAEWIVMPLICPAAVRDIAVISRRFEIPFDDHFDNFISEAPITLAEGTTPLQ